MANKENLQKLGFCYSKTQTENYCVQIQSSSIGPKISNTQTELSFGLDARTLSIPSMKQRNELKKDNKIVGEN